MTAASRLRASIKVIGRLGPTLIKAVYIVPAMSKHVSTQSAGTYRECPNDLFMRSTASIAPGMRKQSAKATAADPYVRVFIRVLCSSGAQHAAIALPTNSNNLRAAA